MYALFVVAAVGMGVESRAVIRRELLQMEIHVRVAGARRIGNRKRMQLLRGGERMLEVIVDALEVRDDRAAERCESVEDEEIRIAAGRELVIEVDVDAIGLRARPRHLAGESVRRSGSGRDDVRIFKRQSAIENHFRAGVARLRQESAIERSFLGAAPDEPSVRLTAAKDPSFRRLIVKRRPVRGAKIEVARDPDAIEKAGNGLALGG